MLLFYIELNSKIYHSLNKYLKKSYIFLNFYLYLVISKKNFNFF